MGTSKRFINVLILGTSMGSPIPGSNGNAVTAGGGEAGDLQLSAVASLSHGILGHRSSLPSQSRNGSG